MTDATALVRYKDAMLELMRTEARGEVVDDDEYDVRLCELDELWYAIDPEHWPALDEWLAEAQEAIDEGRDVY